MKLESRQSENDNNSKMIEITIEEQADSDCENEEALGEDVDNRQVSSVTALDTSVIGLSALDGSLDAEAEVIIDDEKGELVEGEEGEEVKPPQPKKSKKLRILERKAAVNETEQRIKMLKKWKEKLKVLYKNMKRPPAFNVDSAEIGEKDEEVNIGSKS